MRLAGALLGVLLACAAGSLGGRAVGAPLPGAAPVIAKDLSGHPVTMLAPAGSRAVILFFAATDCSLSNRYIPEIEALGKAGGSAPSGVALRWVYPNATDTPARILAQRARFGITGGEVLLDTRHRLTRAAGATVTPEAAILIPASTGALASAGAGGWQVVYAGRVDDRYLALGLERPQATRHDLADALRAALAGQPVPAPGGSLVGCAIEPLGAR